MAHILCRAQKMIYGAFRTLGTLSATTLYLEQIARGAVSSFAHQSPSEPMRQLCTQSPRDVRSAVHHVAHLGVCDGIDKRVWRRRCISLEHQAASCKCILLLRLALNARKG